MSTIAELIREIVKPLLTLSAFTGKVVKVDKDKETCTIQPDDEGPEVFNVRLTAVIKSQDSKQLFIPVVGSEVVVGVLDNNINNCYVAQYSEIEKIEWKAEAIEFNGGENGGLAVVAELVKKFNRLEQKHDALCTQLELLPVPVSGAVSGPPVPGSFSANKINTLTKQSDLENTKVKH